MVTSYSDGIALHKDYNTNEEDYTDTSVSSPKIFTYILKIIFSSIDCYLMTTSLGIIYKDKKVAFYRQ